MEAQFISECYEPHQRNVNTVVTLESKGVLCIWKLSDR